MSLRDIRYDGDGLHYEDHRKRGRTVPLQQFIDRAMETVESQCTEGFEPIEPPVTNEDFEHLRWFPYPAEVG